MGISKTADCASAAGDESFLQGDTMKYWHREATGLTDPGQCRSPLGAEAGTWI